jgi:hypothetical protein
VRSVAQSDFFTEDLPLLGGAVLGGLVSLKLAQRSPKTNPAWFSGGTAAAAEGLARTVNPDRQSDTGKRMLRNLLKGAATGSAALTGVGLLQQSQQKQLPAHGQTTQPPAQPPVQNGQAQHRQAEYVTKDDLQNAVKQELLQHQEAMLDAMKQMRNAIASLSSAPAAPEYWERRDAEEVMRDAGEEWREAEPGEWREASGEEWRDAGEEYRDADEYRDAGEYVAPVVVLRDGAGDEYRDAGEEWRDAEPGEWREATGDEWRDAPSDEAIG